LSLTEERRSTTRTEENIAKVYQIVHENRRLTVRSTAQQVNIDRETVRKILTEDIDMRKVCAKMVPKDPKNKSRVEICQNKRNIEKEAFR